MKKLPKKFSIMYSSTAHFCTFLQKNNLHFCVTDSHTKSATFRNGKLLYIFNQETIWNLDGVPMFSGSEDRTSEEEKLPFFRSCFIFSDSRKPVSYSRLNRRIIKTDVGAFFSITITVLFFYLAE